MDQGGSQTPISSVGTDGGAQSSSKVALGATASLRTSDAKVSKPKRSVVHVACACCRRLRIKCDGVRPTCAPCARRYEDCVYDVEANTTRSNALKRKNEELTKENSQLKELYSFLRNRPMVEAEEIFRRIRSTQNPLDVLRHVATADVLMAQKVNSSLNPPDHEMQPAAVNANRSATSNTLNYPPVHDHQ